MTRALVTGGAGFLGSHLCERLLREGWEVLCYDSLITGSESNVAHLMDHSGFTFVNVNVIQPIVVEGDLDWVMHLASPASPPDYLEHPIHTLKVNSIGTMNALGVAKAKGASFFLTSTSEAYGDPLVHPQSESYWGNVNPIGPRGVYDEGKRFAEAMTMSYHREHSLPVRIVRIFNSILADQTVAVFVDNEMHLEPVGEYASRAQLDVHGARRISVPCLNPSTFRMELRDVSATIAHVAHQDAYELVLRYGRRIKVTGDHSLFVRGPRGTLLAKPARDISPGDHVAIPGRLPVIEKDRRTIRLSDELIKLGPSELWSWSIKHPSLVEHVAANLPKLAQAMLDSGHFARSARPRNTVGCVLRKWMKRGSVPLFVLTALDLAAPEGARIAPYNGSSKWVPDQIALTDDLLWVLGFYLAEGAEHSGQGTHFISMASNDYLLDLAQKIIERELEVSGGRTAPTPGRAPSLYFHSKVVHALFCRLLGLRERRIPRWVLQLPLDRVKFFLEGFRCGDGTHSGKKMGEELCFDTTNEQLAIDLSYLLLRFGIVASFGRYETTYREKYGERRFPFFRLTVCEIDNWDVLSWDRGVRQTLNARRTGDVVWSLVRDVRPCLITGNVFDFSVPGVENFVAGDGVLCHNTYGPRMRRRDGRAVPNFIDQSLKGEQLTVHGDGSQTRSLCYVDDEIEGFWRFINSDHTGPMNIGNPHEVTILKLAETIAKLAGSGADVTYLPRPVDDPEVRCPDIGLARRVLGWEPEVSLEEGLQRTIDWARTAWT
jgi:UDP-glucuronate decarboxylase